MESSPREVSLRELRGPRLRIEALGDRFDCFEALAEFAHSFAMLQQLTVRNVEKGEFCTWLNAG